MKKYLVPMITLILLLSSIIFHSPKEVSAFSLDNAVSINLNETFKGTSKNTLMKFIVPEKGKVDFDIDDHGNYFGVYLRDENGDTLYSPAQDKFTLGLAKGTYYIELDPLYNYRDNTYEIKISFQPDPYYELTLNNNSVSEASPILLNTTYRGLISYYYDNDYYKFQITNKEMLVGVKVKAISEGAQLSLYDMKNNRLSRISNYSSSTGSSIEEVNLLEGEYIINLSGNSNAEYEFEIVTSDFSDVPLDFWATKEISYLSKSRIITGYPTGDFKPNVEVKRAHAAVMIVRALGLDTTRRPDPGFEDVSKDYMYYKEIAAVVDEGYFPKTDSFNPNEPLKRIDMARALVEAYELTGEYEEEIVDILDKNSVEYKYVSALAANNITNIYFDSTFKPEKSVTRAQFSVFFARVLDFKFREFN